MRTRTRTNRKNRWREGVIFGAILLALAAFVGLRSQAGEPKSVTLVAIENQPDRQDQVRADVIAELADVPSGDLVVVGVRDEQPAPAFAGQLTCKAGSDAISCRERAEASRDEAVVALDQLLAQPPSAVVDSFAPVRFLADHLSAQPAEHVTVWLNISTRHNAGGVDLATANLADVPALADSIIAAGLWTEDCAGWTVRVVAPPSADPARDIQVRALWEELLGRCGGDLVSWTGRWLQADTGILSLPEITSPLIEVDQHGDTISYAVSGDVLFEVDAVVLRPEAAAELEQIARSIAERSGGRPIVVTGHTDDRGSDEYNSSLSLQRAAAVEAWLRTYGVPNEIDVRGAGEAEPAAPNTDPEGRARNRRVTISVSGAAS